ncbi:MAG TPA: hypothetical protein VF593_02555 [Chthoniobacteraceae bacterium]|jgi:hypothetical protein
MAARRPDPRAILFERIRTSPPKFVHLVGVPYQVELEACSDPERVDHVWLTLEVPPFGRVRIAVNTLSRISRQAGFDGRVRLGIISGTYQEKPPTGLEECAGFDYGKLEAKSKVAYEFHEHEAVANLLLTKCKAAIRAEVWGDLYARDHIGLHQIHSRRASKAVPLDVRNRDGALKLYYPTDNLVETLLFKFDGQP